LRNWQVTFLLYTLGVFISEYTAKAFTEPRDYRVVFLIQKGFFAYAKKPLITMFRYIDAKYPSIHITNTVEDNLI
ncbi:hypothetical protein, partial [[Ruminococcus] torques]|uniref:hypothetical protein n=1 Tax=[Ruminococcus] torques TaxID=33039 RepID=UPI003AB61775